MGPKETGHGAAMGSKGYDSVMMERGGTRLRGWQTRTVNSGAAGGFFTVDAILKVWVFFFLFHFFFQVQGDASRFGIRISASWGKVSIQFSGSYHMRKKKGKKEFNY